MEVRGYKIGRDADLMGADLARANLRGANLRDADLRDADLRGANLRDADLRDADLMGADLARANLRDADLGDADLRGANLRGANLRDADLGGADLARANLWDADLGGAKNVIRIGPSRDGYEFFGVDHGDRVMIKAGCRWFDADEARAHWKKTRGGTALGDERLRFVAFIEEHFRQAAAAQTGHCALEVKDGGASA